jgi:hypothetical protein
MKGYTKTGLLFLMIAVILMLSTALASFSFYSSFHPTNVQGQNITTMFSLLPLAALGGLGGLLSLIGALFILLGRKEYGEQHRTFIKYAIIIFIITIIIMIIVAIMIAVTVYTWVLSGITTGSTTSLSVNAFQTFMTLTLISTLISAILTGLLWVFALYQLEDKKGRTILIGTFVMMIITATVTVVSTNNNISNWINQGTLDTLFNQTSTSASSVYSQLLSSSPWTGSIGIILVICQLVQNILLFIALYIPYQRISRGELQAVLPMTSAQKQCPTCGRDIPHDAINCPYCGTQL